MNVKRVRSWEHDSEEVAAEERHAAWPKAGMAVSMAPIEAASRMDPKRSVQWPLQQLQLSALASVAMLQ